MGYTLIPNTWLLPPERNEKDKKISELEAKIKELKNFHPDIEVSAYDIKKISLSKLNVIIKKYDKLSSGVVDKLVSECQSRNPLTTDFESHTNYRPAYTKTAKPGYRWTYVPPSKNQIEKYKDILYPQWIKNLIKYFAKIHQYLETPDRHIIFNLDLRNSGNVPAENTIVEMHALGGILFYSPEDNIEKANGKPDKFPEIPFPPKGIWKEENLLSSVGGYGFGRSKASAQVLPYHEPLSFFPLDKDRNAFYWKNNKGATFAQVWKFECQEFRHKVDPKTFKVGFFIPFEKEIKNAAIELIVTAKNLNDPFKLKFSIHIRYSKENTESKALELVEKNLPKYDMLHKG